MPTIIAAAIFATGLVVVFVVGAMVDVNVFDHYDRGLGRGISVTLLSWFAPVAALLSTPTYFVALTRLRFVPKHVASLTAGGLVAASAWVLTWASLLFVEYTSPVTAWVAAATLVIGGFLAALTLKYAYAPKILPANP